MLADYYGYVNGLDGFGGGSAMAESAKDTAKLALGITLGTAAYMAAAIPGNVVFSPLSPKTASLAYATLAGLGSVWLHKKYAPGNTLVRVGTASAFGWSVFTALSVLLQPITAGASPIAAALPPVAPGGAVSGLFDLDNKAAIRALTHIPFGS